MHVPRVVDADGHCQEPEEGLAQWMPKELASRAPRRVTDNLGQPRVLIEGRVWDSEFPESVTMVAGTPGLSQVRLKLVLGQNAIRWFNLKESDLPGESVYFVRSAPATAPTVESRSATD